MNVLGGAPIWVKKGIEAWQKAARINRCRLLCTVEKNGKLRGESLSDRAILSVVERSAKQIGCERS